MTNPDGHFSENTSEYLHWMVTNIKGNDLSTGQIVAPYLQPFPPFGTGYHRFVFILFKQVREHSNIYFIQVQWWQLLLPQSPLYVVNFQFSRRSDWP